MYPLRACFGHPFVRSQVLFGKGLQADTKPLVDIFADVLSHKFELRSAYATVVGQVNNDPALDIIGIDSKTVSLKPQEDLMRSCP